MAFIKNIDPVFCVQREGASFTYVTAWADEPSWRNKWSSAVFNPLLCWGLRPGNKLLQVVHIASEVSPMFSNVLVLLHFPLLFTDLHFFPYPSRQFCSLISPSWSCPCPGHRLPQLAPTHQPQLTKNCHPRWTLTFTVNRSLTWPCNASFSHQLCDNDFIPILQIKKLKWILQAYNYRNPGHLTRHVDPYMPPLDRFVSCIPSTGVSECPS